jgi:uncharacterized membrane protein YeiH
MLEQLLFDACVAVGTIAFAMSGAFKAVRHELDVLGLLVLGFVTALGGGLLRDTLLHQTPAAFLDIGPAGFAMIGCLLVFLSKTFFHERTLPHARPEGHVFLLLDAVGLAAFTVSGARLAMEADLNVFGVVLLAAITGVGGGVMRDLLVAEVPLVLKADFYATATIIGAIVFYIDVWAGMTISTASLVTFAFTLLLRTLAIRLRWQLPKVKDDDSGKKGDDRD